MFFTQSRPGSPRRVGVLTSADRTAIAHYVGMLFFGMAFLGVAGCGGGTVVQEVPTGYVHLKAISMAWARATDKLEHPPNSLAELLPYFKDLGDPEELLRSPEDNELYVIVWGADQRAQGVPPVIAYEKDGRGGRRYVLRGRMIQRMDEEAFNKALNSEKS